MSTKQPAAPQQTYSEALAEAKRNIVTIDFGAAEMAYYCAREIAGDRDPRSDYEQEAHNAAEAIKKAIIAAGHPHFDGGSL